MLGNKLLNIQFAKYHIWNNKSEGFPNMVLSTETFNQSVRTEYSEAVNARYTFQPLWVSDVNQFRAVPLMPILELRRARRMLWSTVSNAALTSRRTRRVTCSQLIFMRMSFCTFSKRIVRVDKGRIDSYDCEFGRKQHALSVLI